jgi:hypothetical protein
VQLYQYFASQSSEFCHHNPLCCFSTSNTKGKRIFRYGLSPETSGYTLVYTQLAKQDLMLADVRATSFCYLPSTVSILTTISCTSLTSLSDQHIGTTVLPAKYCWNRLVLRDFTAGFSLGDIMPYRIIVDEGRYPKSNRNMGWYMLSARVHTFQ